LTKTKIFFVSDVHGSDRCFRKFVNAGKFYGANVLILGGDITGKMIVPLVAQPDGTRACSYLGRELVLNAGQETDGMIKTIKDSGFYPYLTDQREFEEISARPDELKALFKRLMRESVEGWMKLAEQRLSGSGIKCFVSPGNDDFFEIDEALNSAAYVVNPEEKVVTVDGEHEMITLGYTNHTPWNSPREVDEDVLWEKIERMTSQVREMGSAIFNIHIPPINTPLDQAPKLDETLKPVLSGGNPVLISVGSTAVRRSIEAHQPLIGLHGHIHESRGFVKLGRTMCFNPGSTYAMGDLHGLLCELDGKKIRSYVLTSG